MKAKSRRFIDAIGGTRCEAIVTLKDKSTAQCGRIKTSRRYCTQHDKLARATAQQPTAA